MHKRIFEFLMVLFITEFCYAADNVIILNNDNHPMHWQRFWAGRLLEKNQLTASVVNFGSIISPAKPGGWPGWPGSPGYTGMGSVNFYVCARVIDLSSFINKPVPYTSIPPAFSNGEQEFPILSHGYISMLSPGAMAPISSDRTHMQIWEPIPGFYNDGIYGWIGGISEDTNNDGELSPGEDVNNNGILDLNLDPPDDNMKSIAISTDRRTWPEFWPGGSYIGDDRPYFGRPPQTISPGMRAGKWNGEYKAAPIADIETIYMMDDHENDHLNDWNSANYWPMKNSDDTPDTTTWEYGGIAGAGIEVENRTYAWIHPLAADIFVSHYKMRNYSDYDLNDVVAGIYADSGPAIRPPLEYIPAEFDSNNGGGRENVDIMYLWHVFPDGINTGISAIAFLESPGNDYSKMYDGIDNDNDWRGYNDIGLDGVSLEDPNYVGPDNDGTESNGIWDTEDINLNGILDIGEDNNNNNELDMEPVNDDTGTDGLSPNDGEWPGPDPDGSECNGFMDLGEPNFDITDMDEADLEGLKYLYSFESRQDILNPETFWQKYLKNKDIDLVDTDENVAFTFGSRSILLERNQWKRFSIALMMEQDVEAMLDQTEIMQKIYDNNYLFLRPPLQPTLESEYSEGLVQLSWDSIAEQSRDPLLGKDFNGYRLYKSSDPHFEDIINISDALGNVLLFTPVAIFDKIDGLTGLHPVPFPDSDVYYNMGNDSGLQHSYQDTVDTNSGYYYAVTAIDAGNDLDFVERGLVSEQDSIKAVPCESPFNVIVNVDGAVVYKDKNVVYLRLNTGVLKTKNVIVKNASLSSNYPNPFNPETKIEYYIPKSSHVTISVFNSIGQKVRTLFEGKKLIGKHSQIWDGRNDEGILLPTGSYFCLLKTGSTLLKRKILLLK